MAESSLLLMVIHILLLLCIAAFVDNGLETILIPLKSCHFSVEVYKVNWDHPLLSGVVQSMIDFSLPYIYNQTVALPLVRYPGSGRVPKCYARILVLEYQSTWRSSWAENLWRLGGISGSSHYILPILADGKYKESGDHGMNWEMVPVDMEVPQLAPQNLLLLDFDMSFKLTQVYTLRVFCKALDLICWQLVWSTGGTSNEELISILLDRRHYNFNKWELYLRDHAPLRHVVDMSILTYRYVFKQSDDFTKPRFLIGREIATALNATLETVPTGTKLSIQGSYLMPEKIYLQDTLNRRSEHMLTSFEYTNFLYCRNITDATYGSFMAILKPFNFDVASRILLLCTTTIVTILMARGGLKVFKSLAVLVCQHMKNTMTKLLPLYLSWSIFSFLLCTVYLAFFETTMIAPLSSLPIKDFETLNKAQYRPLTKLNNQYSAWVSGGHTIISELMNRAIVVDPGIVDMEYYYLLARIPKSCMIAFSEDVRFAALTAKHVLSPFYTCTTGQKPAAGQPRFWVGTYPFEKGIYRTTSRIFNSGILKLLDEEHVKEQDKNFFVSFIEDLNATRRNGEFVEQYDQFSLDNPQMRVIFLGVVVFLLFAFGVFLIELTIDFMFEVYVVQS